MLAIMANSLSAKGKITFINVLCIEIHMYVCIYKYVPMVLSC